MFHEVAHGLGIKNTINGRGTVRQALKERQGALEEEKADVLGLYMVAALNARGELKERPARQLRHLPRRHLPLGALRSRRRARAGQHGHLLLPGAQGAFARDSASGTYRVDQARMAAAVDSLAGKILQLQGTGDYAGTASFYDASGRIGPVLQGDLDRLKSKGIPVDIVFEQGADVLGLPAGR